MEAENFESLFIHCPFPITWHHFQTEMSPPFAIWKEEESDNVISDEKVLEQIDHFRVEFYYESWIQKKQFEQFLMSLNIIWQRVVSDVWISNEEMYLSTYELGDGFGYESRNVFQRG